MTKAELAVNRIAERLRQDPKPTYGSCEEILLEIFGSCACNAEENEPTFTLRAQDQTAPYHVRNWAEAAQLRGAPAEKIRGAHGRALEMEGYQQMYGSKVPD